MEEKVVAFVSVSVSVVVVVVVVVVVIVVLFEFVHVFSEEMCGFSASQGRTPSNDTEHG